MAIPVDIPVYCTFGFEICATRMEWLDLWASVIASIGGVFLAFTLGARSEKSKIEGAQTAAQQRLLTLCDNCLRSGERLVEPPLSLIMDHRQIDVPEYTQPLLNAWNDFIMLDAHLEWIERAGVIHRADQLAELELLKRALAAHKQYLLAAQHEVALNVVPLITGRLRSIFSTTKPHLQRSADSLRN
jgi:hypothetical protein